MGVPNGTIAAGVVRGWPALSESCLRFILKSWIDHYRAAGAGTCRWVLMFPTHHLLRRSSRRDLRYIVRGAVLR